MSMNDYAMDMAEDIISDMYNRVSEGEITFDDTQRIYSFLTERYTPFWFNKYAKVKYWPWVYCDITKF